MLSGELTEELITAITAPRCPKSQSIGRTRQKRYAFLGSPWVAENLPLGIKFRNYASGISSRYQEAIAEHCARVSMRRYLYSLFLVSNHPPGNESILKLLQLYVSR